MDAVRAAMDEVSRLSDALALALLLAPLVVGVGCWLLVRGRVSRAGLVGLVGGGLYVAILWGMRTLLERLWEVPIAGQGAISASYRAGNISLDDWFALSRTSQQGFGLSCAVAAVLTLAAAAVLRRVAAKRGAVRAAAARGGREATSVKIA